MEIYLKGGLDPCPHDMGHLLCQNSMGWLSCTQLLCNVEQQVHLAIQGPRVLQTIGAGPMSRVMSQAKRCSTERGTCGTRN